MQKVRAVTLHQPAGIKPGQSEKPPITGRLFLCPLAIVEEMN